MFHNPPKSFLILLISKILLKLRHFLVESFYYPSCHLSLDYVFIPQSYHLLNSTFLIKIFMIDCLIPYYAHQLNDSPYYLLWSLILPLIPVVLPNFNTLDPIILVMFMEMETWKHYSHSGPYDFWVGLFWVMSYETTLLTI